MKEIKQLLEITGRLKKQYGRNFTLDGRLVGDIGEVLTAEKYGLELLSENTHIHDAFVISEPTTFIILGQKTDKPKLIHKPHITKIHIGKPTFVEIL